MRQQYYFYVAVVFILIPVFASRPMTSLFAIQLEASMIEIGLITACFSFAPLLMAVFAGRHIDRYGERIPLLIGSTGIALSLCLPYFFPKIQTLYISQLILGFSHLLALLSIQNGVAKTSSARNLSRSIGSFSLFSSLGVLFGPLIGGYVSEQFGFKTSYLLLSFVPLISAIVCIYISNSSSPKEQIDNKKMNGFLIYFLYQVYQKLFLLV